MGIHPTAIVSQEAEIADDVVIGPFCTITGKVKIGSGSRLESHALVGNPHGIVELGKNNHIFPGAVIGGPPQDLSYKNEVTRLIIGDGNIFRECVTVNCGTFKEQGITRIGNNCLIMAYVHVAHDCQLGDHVVVANTTQFAGHVKVDSNVRIGGVVAIAQFNRIGKYAYIGGGSTVNKDVLPFSIAEGNFAKVRATNKIGMTRAGFPRKTIDDINRAIRFLIMGGRTMEEALKLIADECGDSDEIKHLVSFINSSSNGIAR